MTADYLKAQKEANKVLKENYITTPPVRIDEIAQNYGIRVLEAEFPHDNENMVAGLIDINRKIIYVNAKDFPNRKTFTIAHELGHLLMHKEKLKKDPKYAILYRIPLGESSKDPIEREANCFAANLLVPQDLLTKYLDQGLSQNEIAGIFAVSSEVIGYRINDVAHKC